MKDLNSQSNADQKRIKKGNPAVLTSKHLGNSVRKSLYIHVNIVDFIWRKVNLPSCSLLLHMHTQVLAAPPGWHCPSLPVHPCSPSDTASLGASRTHDGLVLESSSSPASLFLSQVAKTSWIFVCSVGTWPQSPREESRMSSILDQIALFLWFQNTSLENVCSPIATLTVLETGKAS